ncbi:MULTISPECIES: DUF4383 domain-containing protein [unclassified Nocardiopsis]|uniref:DUF4383 domain-containing protein n=1 Tax=unclassified Nocardiopsis TaxID=2649073 RepID=UPI00066AD37B|nr:MULTISPECIES: DUF4383 domain-containing protein [unclassified Nocardiopsis]MBQ1083806.1 DUF4383 domain-containing protein [Nocardiopsis sp. B62]
MDLDTTRRADRRLDHVYRFGAGLTGLVLVGFGSAGMTIRLPLFDTQGEVVAGLSTNGALSFLSIAFGSLLVGAAILGGKFASTVCVTVGGAFLVSGLVNLVLMSTDFNILAFSVPNVIFSYVVGLVLITFGMYGRFTGNLPADNPFRRYRHRGEGADEGGADAERASAEGAAGASADERTDHGVPGPRSAREREDSPEERRG